MSKSLAECVRRSWADFFGVRMDPNMGWPEKCADKIINELARRMNEEKRRYVDHVQPIYAEAINDMLRVLRNGEMEAKT